MGKGGKGAKQMLNVYCPYSICLHVNLCVALSVIMLVILLHNENKAQQSCHLAHSQVPCVHIYSHSFYHYCLLYIWCCPIFWIIFAYCWKIEELQVRHSHQLISWHITMAKRHPCAVSSRSWLALFETVHFHLFNDCCYNNCYDWHYFLVFVGDLVHVCVVVMYVCPSPRIILVTF